MISHNFNKRSLGLHGHSRGPKLREQVLLAAIAGAGAVFVVVRDRGSGPQYQPVYAIIDGVILESGWVVGNIEIMSMRNHQSDKSYK
eukprot:3704973-Amphidinium_carterae.1